jgi:hypothetical protein
VFKELRAQNHDFFKEYYTMHDLKKQREKFGRLTQAYHARKRRSAGVVPETTAATMETDTTASMEWSDQQAEQAGCDGELARLIGGGGDGDQFAGASLPQQQGVHCPGGGQQSHHEEQAVYEYDERLQETGTPWAEEAVPAPAQSVANGMFQGVAWPQQPAGQQLLYHHLEQAGHLPTGLQQQLSYQELEDCLLPANPPPRYMEQAAVVPLPAGQQLHYQQEQDLPGMPLLHYQQQPLHLPAEQLQLQCYQEQLMMASGGHTRTLSQGGIGWGKEQPAPVGPPRRRWPGAGADPSPSSTLPGGEQQPGNQNFHSSNAGIYERPQ